jgi:hypothetical protein
VAGITTISLIKATAAGIAVVMVALPFVRSDAPPYASVQRVNDLASMIRADLKATLIVPLHSRECEAQRTGQPALADSYASQVMELQAEYRALAGNDYPLHGCSP